MLIQISFCGGGTQVSDLDGLVNLVDLIWSFGPLGHCLRKQW